MTELDKIITGFCEREEKAGCYEYEVAGIKAYNLIRFKIRNDYLQSKGFNFVENYKGANYFEVLKSLTKSTIQLSKIWFGKKKYATLFYPFLRLDCVNGLYLDKFTDPVIDVCKLDDYIIFERGRRGLHLIPRIHQSKVVYTNLLDYIIVVLAKIKYKWFVRQYKEELDRLFLSIDSIMDGVSYNRDYLCNRILCSVYTIKIYEKLLRRMEVKKIFAPSRNNITSLMYVGRKNNITVYEYQHGITYGETALYSGRRESEFVPEYFLAFGDTPPRNVYGIDESRIYNIGWAFQDYLDNINTGEDVSENDVLVISGPCLTDKILDATIRLATLFSTIQFVVRPHPAEVVTDAHRERASKYANISWQDPKVNVAVAMKQYNHLIGENSTVLYEALTYGKKVARICFDGFSPRYLTPEDEECFWKISDKASFEAFINGKVEDKKSMKIYSKFDKELFLKLYNA